MLRLRFDKVQRRLRNSVNDYEARKRGEFTFSGHGSIDITIGALTVCYWLYQLCQSILKRI